MKITIQPTTKIINLKSGTFGDAIQARLWEGETETGIKVHCMIALIGVSKDETRLEEFHTELKEVTSPSAEMQVYPLSLIL